MDYNMLCNIPSMVLLSCSIVTQVDYINKSIYIYILKYMYQYIIIIESFD
jgi:hypothetical protein